MSLGWYRLSIDEQQQSRDDALRKARLRRIAAVRGQDCRFAAEQLQKYRSSLEVEEARAIETFRVQRVARRRALITSLQQQYREEAFQLGNAQRDAVIANESETALLTEKRRKQKVADFNKRQRFHKALSLVRKNVARNQQAIAHLVTQRKLETIQDRRKAISYGKRHRYRKPGYQETHELINRQRRDLPIDFHSTRAHEQLGVEQNATDACTITRHPVQNAEESMGEDAMIAAKTERLRVSAEVELKTKRRAVDDERARDRGHVALLRERAIVQREIHESRLEQSQRAEVSYRRRFVVPQRRPLRNRAQVTVDCPRVQDLPRLEKTLSKAPDAPNRCMHIHRPKQFKESEVESRREISIQVDLDKDDDEASQEKRGDQEKENQKNKEPIELAKQEADLTESRKKSASTKQTSSTPFCQKTVNVEFSDTKSADTSVQKNQNSAKTTPKDEQTHATSTQHTSDQHDNVMAETVAAVTNETTDHRSQPDAIGLNLKAEVNENWNHYEDSLSEALSLDTDQFLIARLQDVTSPSDAETNTLDSLNLDTLSALISESEVECTEDGTAISNSTLDSEITSLGISWPSLSITLSPDPSAQATSPALSDLSIPSNLTLDEFSDLDQVLHGIDRISHDSLKLLSNFSSTLLSTETPFEQMETSSSPTSYASLGNAASTKHTLLGTLPQCTSESEHWALDTIAEGSDSDDMSLSSKSLEREG